VRQLVSFVLVVAFAGGAYALLQTDAASPAVARATQVLTTSPAAPTAPATTGPSTTAVVRATSAAFTLVMNDADLTAAAANGFPQTVSGVTVSDPKVSVESAGVRLTASAKVFFGSTQFVMTATPTVTDGHVVVRVDTATLAGLTLPDSTKASIADTVQGTIAKLIPTTVRVTSVSFVPGRLTVQGAQP